MDVAALTARRRTSATLYAVELPRTPPLALVFLDLAPTRHEAIERLYIRRILTQLCLQNSISCVGKAEIKADINPLTILALYGHRLTNLKDICI